MNRQCFIRDGSLCDIHLPRVIRESETADLEEICEIAQTSFSSPWKRDDFEPLIHKDMAVFLVSALCGNEDVDSGRDMAAEGKEPDMADEGRSPDMADEGRPPDTAAAAGSDPEEIDAADTPCRAYGIAGYGCIQLAADEGDLLSVAVRKELRGAGIGASLLDALLAEAAQKGARRIFLEVRESNVPAIRMYERAGFQQVGIRKNYYTDPVENALLMRWEQGGEDVRKRF